MLSEVGSAAVAFAVGFAVVAAVIGVSLEVWKGTLRKRSTRNPL